MKIKHHAKTTEERMMVYYDSIIDKAEHHRNMILAGWSIDLERTKFDSPIHWVRRDTETIVRFKHEDEDF